jgi:hypothetical protein
VSGRTYTYSTDRREWMIVGKFPYYNRIGRMMYDEDGRCTYCGHHADKHDRGCRLRGYWCPKKQAYSNEHVCDCWMESPRHDAEGAMAAALWNAGRA